MITYKETDKNILEATFYNTPFYFSYSSMNTLLESPVVFYKKYILKQKDIEFNKHLLEGTLIHYLILDGLSFDEKFLVMPNKLPSANTINVLDKIYNLYKEKLAEDPSLNLSLDDFHNEILQELIDTDLHQGLKDTKDGTGDSKRLAKIIEPTSIAYFDFLKTKGDKTIIDTAILDKCSKRADIIKQNPELRELLGLDIIPDGKSFGVYNELFISIEAEDGMPFGYKGILDNMVVDVAKKVVRINDFKTTSKTIAMFPESVEFWNYWLQAVVYVKLVKHYLKNVIKDDWVIEFRFLVFDKYDQFYAYEVTNETMFIWINKFLEKEKELLFHFNSKNFELPYNFANRNVKL
jgi:hypothetical protein